MVDYSLTHEERTEITTQMLCDWIYNTEALWNEMKDIVKESHRLSINLNPNRRWHGQLLRLLATACQQMDEQGLNVPDHNTNCYWAQVLEYFEGDAGRYDVKNRENP